MAWFETWYTNNLIHVLTHCWYPLCSIIPFMELTIFWSWFLDISWFSSSCSVEQKYWRNCWSGLKTYLHPSGFWCSNKHFAIDCHIVLDTEIYAIPLWWLIRTVSRAAKYDFRMPLTMSMSLSLFSFPFSLGWENITITISLYDNQLHCWYAGLDHQTKVPCDFHSRPQAEE